MVVVALQLQHRVVVEATSCCRVNKSSSEATVFLEFHFRGFDVLLGAGRQSEAVSVLGVSALRAPVQP